MEPIGVEGGEVSPGDSRGSNEKSHPGEARGRSPSEGERTTSGGPARAFSRDSSARGQLLSRPGEEPLSRSARSSPSATSPRSDGDAGGFPQEEARPGPFERTLSERSPAVLGVTGAVAAGKSALSRLLAALGADVIDVDRLGHDVLATPEVRDAVVRTFGRSVRAADRSLDRAALARLAFASDGARRHLEEIVHPAVRTLVDARLGEA